MPGSAQQQRFITFGLGGALIAVGLALIAGAMAEAFGGRHTGQGLPAAAYFEGCTPGFWRNNLAPWQATPYSPDDDFNTVFGRTAFEPPLTLHDVLELGGGGLNALSRQAVAALLNAAHPDVHPREEIDTAAEVIALWQAAFDSGDPELIEQTKDFFEQSNESDCPIDAHGRTTPTKTAVATATKTPVPTATKTPTKTPTATPRKTETATPTATGTPVHTATPTRTATPVTATVTGTPVADTATPTATRTATATATSTAVASPTLTPTATATGTPVTTATPTSTPTAVPTATPTPDTVETPVVQSPTPTGTPQTPTTAPTATPTLIRVELGLTPTPRPGTPVRDLPGAGTTSGGAGSLPVAFAGAVLVALGMAVVAAGVRMRGARA